MNPSLNISFTPFEEVPVQQWSQFVDECEECWAYHRPELINIHRSDSRSFAIWKENKLIGVCVLYVNNVHLGKILGSRMGPAGLALKKNVPKKIYSLIFEHLQYLAKKNHCLAIEMNLCGLATIESSSSDYLSSHLGKLGFSVGLRHFGTDYLPSFTSIINLSNSSEDISGDFYASVKQKCAKFSKYSYRYSCFEENIQTKNWEEFEVNHRATFEKTGSEPFTEQMLGYLYGLIKNGLALLLNVYVDGKCCASLFLITYKRRAFYFASGVKSEFYDSGVTAYIHQLAILELKRKGYFFYELGQFFPTKSLKGTKVYSIGQFKKMFGGKKQMVLSGEYIFNESLYFLLILLPGYFRKLIRYFWKNIR